MLFRWRKHHPGTKAALGSALLLSACMPLPANIQAVRPMPPELQAIENRLQADCEAGRFSGVAAARTQGRLVFLHSCGFTDAERRNPITADARFKLFSISKPFTAAAILRLVEDGRIDLDESIRRYLPDAPPAWDAVSIRHLLHHQSGIPDHTNKLLEAYADHGDRSHSDAMRRTLSALTAAGEELASSPGSEWKYSNFGYELLAHAAATVENRPFHELIRDYILEPAGMDEASVELPVEGNAELTSESSPGLVPGYVGSPEQWKPTRSYSFIQQGAGALHASYRDLLAFDAALNRGEVISPEMQRRNVTESVKASETARYGFGWLIRSIAGCTYWQHSGGTNGYVSDFARLPEKQIAVVVLSNLGFAKAHEIRRDLMDALVTEETGCESEAQAVP